MATYDRTFRNAAFLFSNETFDKFQESFYYEIWNISDSQLLVLLIVQDTALIPCLSVCSYILSPWVKSSTFTMVWSCLQMMVKSTFLTVSSTVASFCSTRYHFSVSTNITQPEPRQAYLPTLITKLQNFRLSVIPSVSGYTRCSMGEAGSGGVRGRC